MNCWEILGLESDADERSIKRHYARLLKSTRPDEDAGAFQALREAYEQALQRVQWRVEEEGEESPQVDILPIPTAPASHQLPDVSAQQQQQQQQLQQLLVGITPSCLTERREKAEAAGLALPFERGLLQHCLETPGSHDLLDAACVEYAWLEVDRRSALTEDECLAVRSRLLRELVLQLRQFLNKGEDMDFQDGLESLRRRPWLQSYDARALLDEAVVELLLEVPYWPAGMFDRVAAIFDWHEGRRVPNCPDHLWTALLHRRDAECYFENLEKDAQTWDLRPEVRAARLILTPFDRFQRRRFSADFSAADWACCQRIADTLQYRFPHLLDRLPEGQRDPWFWRDLPRKEAPWNVGRFLLWMAAVMVFGVFWLPGQIEHGGEFFPKLLALVVFSTIPYGVMGFLLRTFQAFTDNRLNRFDYWLSGKLLPEQWHEQGAGMRPLRGGALSYGLALVGGEVAGLSGWMFWLGSIFLAVVILALMHIARRTQFFARASEIVMAGIRRQGTVLLRVGLVLLCLSVAGYQVYSQRQQLLSMQFYKGKGNALQERCSQEKHRNDLMCILAWSPSTSL